MAITVLEEDFTSLADWTLVGSVAQFGTGYHGMGFRIGSSAGTATYTIPALSESDTITVGFWWRASSYSTKPIVSLRSDAAATAHITVAVISDGTIQIRRGLIAGTLLVSSAANAIVAPGNTWHYIEVQAKLHDTTGFATVRVNGVQVATYSGDTKNAGTKTTFDSVFLTTTSTTLMVWDDFYIVTGSDGVFRGPQAFGAVNDAIHEDFDDLSAWTTGGSGDPATIVSGRTGTAVNFTNGGRWIEYALPVPAYQVVVGFAIRLTGTLATVAFFDFRAGGGSNMWIRCNADGSLNITNTLSPTPAGTLATDGVWRYVEAKIVNGGPLAAKAAIRVNDTVLGTPAQDTNTGLSAALITSVRVTVPLTGASSGQIDDLYVLTGELAEFEGDQGINPPATAATMNVWDGDSFEPCPARIWDGTTFVDSVAVKVWNGTAFVDAI